MPRVKRGTMHVKRRRRLLKRVKGYRWGRKKLIKVAKVAALKAGRHAYASRKRLKREKRNEWQVTINAAVREHGLSYSKFMGKLKTQKIEIDRKMLAKLAEEYPKVFAQIVEKIKG